MKELPLQLIRKGFDYKLIQRNSKAAIYSQSKEGRLLAYEVVKILIAKPYILNSIQFPGGECFPHDEAFGQWAWSYTTTFSQEEALQKATNKFNEITNKEENGKEN